MATRKRRPRKRKAKGKVRVKTRARIAPKDSVNVDSLPEARTIVPSNGPVFKVKVRKKGGK